MNKYRITFSNPATGNWKDYEIEAESTKEAFRIAYSMPDAKCKKYNSVGVMRITDEPKVYGLEVEYKDMLNGRNLFDYLLIKAATEADAIAYYNNNMKGKTFRYEISEDDKAGKRVRGKIRGSYLAAGNDFHVDATAMCAV